MTDITQFLLAHGDVALTNDMLKAGAHAGCAPPKIGKNMIFLRKIMIFLNEIPQNFSRITPLGAIILSAPPNLKSWIRPCEMSTCTLLIQ